uniref:Uncharacterized protein n=1 Tax=Arion vulgaris TaxID=1028688 RepID=A0A0B7B8T0_9EUPU
MNFAWAAAFLPALLDIEQQSNTEIRYLQENIWIAPRGSKPSTFRMRREHLTSLPQRPSLQFSFQT